VIQAAGVLLYRKTLRGIEVLLVHPSGDYNASSPWSIPKGHVDPGEEAENTAIRELLEETGVNAPKELHFLGEVIYKNGKKRVQCFIGQGDTQIPFCGSWEVDKAEYLSFEQAEIVIAPNQREFLIKLKAILNA
jgi:predicted NUDIX family NTP pyrophosphohydrolase